MLYQYFLHIHMYAVTIFHSTLKLITRHTRITGINVIFSGYTCLSRRRIIFIYFFPLKLTFTCWGAQKAHFLLIRLSLPKPVDVNFTLKKTKHGSLFKLMCPIYRNYYFYNIYRNKNYICLYVSTLIYFHLKFF